MKTFLNVIAGAYSERYGDISSLTFIMPNKRSGSFLLKAFADLTDKPVISPRILPISDFVASVSDLVPDSRIDMIFRLYSCYCRLPGADPDMQFDKFSSWGETLVSDFNEIDMQMVDPDEIFKNVYDINSIKTNFLSSAQRKVMVEYFGYSADILEADFSRFWQDFEGKGKSSVRKKFRALWQLLNPLYKSFKESLEADGLTTTGGAYREAVKKIEAGYEPFEGDKLVFVGFNALSASEIRIFSALKKMELRTGERKADFIWDFAPSVFSEGDEPSLKYVSVNSKYDNFPEPEWISAKLRGTIPHSAPEIKVISVPSNVMQAKVAGMELAALFGLDEENGAKPSESEHKNIRDDIRNARIAIVLPDENLLLPLLFSLPAEIRTPNLTMGFPLRHTPVISFASLLRRIHAGAVTTADTTLYHFEDIKDFLGHPYTRLLFSRDKTESFIRGYMEKRRVMVPATSLLRLGTNAKTVFRIFNEGENPSEVVDYLIEVINMVRTALEEEGKENEKDHSGYLRAHVEKVYIGTYGDALIRLKHSMEEYPCCLSPRDVFVLSERMIAGESVVFDGRPLEGLQIMGVLETRCLDFDRVIMLSVNEKVMPRVGRNSTFIPNIIRTAFGMPPANYQEELFAYYFFRVLGRCRYATLTYDSRSSENRTPGPSRYVLQLKYLTRDIKLRELEARFNLPRGLQGKISVEKSAGLLPFLEQYTASSPDGRKKFSASALSHYFRCPVQFLYADVLRLGEEREKIETIDSIDLGTIVHRAIERLYVPKDKRGRMLKTPIVITVDFLRGLLDETSFGKGETRIEREARLAILEVHFGMDETGLEHGNLRGSASIIFDYIIRYLRNIIECDLNQAPFRLWGSEINRTVEYTLSSGSKIEFKMIIDRLDQSGAEGNDTPFRIVDYKTGGVHLDAENLEQVFDGTPKAYNIFQLYLYSELLAELARRGELKLPEGYDVRDFEHNLKAVIYKIPALPLVEGIVFPSIGQIPGNRGGMKRRELYSMSDFREIEREEGVNFMDKLEEVVRTILDPGVPFEAEPSDERCGLCEFRLRCEARRASNETSTVK